MTARWPTDEAFYCRCICGQRGGERGARLVKGGVEFKVCAVGVAAVKGEKDRETATKHAAYQLFMHAFVYALCGEGNVQMN